MKSRQFGRFTEPFQERGDGDLDGEHQRQQV